MSDETIDISVITITGNPDYVFTRAFQALVAQTVSCRMEVVILRYGKAASDTGHSLPGTCPHVREMVMDVAEPFVNARAKGIVHAKGTVAAIIEDHCIPEPDWAERLVEAFHGPRMVVGYVFTNGSPDSNRYRSFFMAEYGLWTHPAREQEVATLPDNNIAYHRKKLLALCNTNEEELRRLVSSPETFRQQGIRLTLQAGARVAHQSYRYAADLFRAHFHYSRVLGGTRAEQGGWGMIRRTLYAVSVPVVVPSLQVFRIFHNQRKRNQPFPKKFLRQIPVIFCLFQVAAIGELSGYVFGQGEAGSCLDRMELSAPRIGT